METRRNANSRVPRAHASNALKILKHCYILLDFKLWESQSVSQFSRSVVSNSLRPHESQHARPPCPSPAPGKSPYFQNLTAPSGNYWGGGRCCFRWLALPTPPWDSCSQSCGDKPLPAQADLLNKNKFMANYMGCSIWSITKSESTWAFMPTIRHSTAFLFLFFFLIANHSTMRGNALKINLGILFFIF